MRPIMCIKCRVFELKRNFKKCHNIYNDDSDLFMGIVINTVVSQLYDTRPFSLLVACFLFCTIYSRIFLKYFLFARKNAMKML